MKQIINGKLYDTEKCKFIAAFVLHADLYITLYGDVEEG